MLARSRAYVLACSLAFLHASVRASLLACLLASVLACLIACMRACVLACLLGCVRACDRSCLLARLRACVCACVHACLLAGLRACLLDCWLASVLACLSACVLACARASYRGRRRRQRIHIIKRCSIGTAAILRSNHYSSVVASAPAQDFLRPSAAAGTKKSTSHVIVRVERRPCFAPTTTLPSPASLPDTVS